MFLSLPTPKPWIFAALLACVGSVSSSAVVRTYAYMSGQHIALASVAPLAIPSGAQYAEICADQADVKYTTDGVTSPTSAAAMTLKAGACLSLWESLTLDNWSAYSATGAIDVKYFQ